MYKPLLFTFGLFVVISVAGLAMLWDKTKPQQPQPEHPKAAATAQQNTAVQDYYKDKTRCPKVKIDPELLRQFPELPNVLATLKYALDRGSLNLDRERDKTRRENILQILDDPSLELKYDPPPKPIEEIAKDLLAEKSIAVGRTASANRIDLSPFAGGAAAKDGMPWRNPFRLAHTILHELVHVAQVRHEGAPINTVATHSGLYENPAYRWEHSFSEADKSLFHSDSWKQLQLPCSTQQRTELPDDSNRGEAQLSFVVVLDGSGSMTEKNRIKATKDAVMALLESGFPPGSEVGLVVFLDCGRVEWHNFTMRPASLKSIVGGVTPSGGTPLAASITLAGEHLRGASGSAKKLILATDGKESCGGNPVRAASDLQQLKVASASMQSSIADAPALLYSPSLERRRPSSNSFMNVFDERSQLPEATGITVDVLGIDVSDETQLRAIAAAGKGKYYSAANLTDIKKALSESVETASVIPKGAELPKGSEATVSVRLAIILTSVVVVLIGIGGLLLWVMRPSKRLARAGYLPMSKGINRLTGGRCPNPRCGQMLRPGIKFCSACGTRVA